MTYIARRRKTLEEIEYIISKTKDENILKFFNDVKYYMKKYTPERLLNLGKLKYKNSAKHLDKPIEFKELSFTSTDQTDRPIVKYNTNFNSCINSFIELNAQSKESGYKSLYIPTKFSKKYHKNHKLYGSKNSSLYTYSPAQ